MFDRVRGLLLGKEALAGREAVVATVYVQESSLSLAQKLLGTALTDYPQIETKVVSSPYPGMKGITMGHRDVLKRLGI